MQYLKLGPLKIPYQVKTNSSGKNFQIGGIKVPFSTYTSGGNKYYELGFLRLRESFFLKYRITQHDANYQMRYNLDDEKIEEISIQIFKEKVGYVPDLDHPRSMNEKIFWMKLHYHNPLVTKCCDKFCVKEYVDEILGPGHTVPSLASWERAEDIDFSVFPEQYALKVNWSSGYNVIVKDKSLINEDEVRKKVAHWMLPQQNSYYQTFNWGYKDMKPVVYAEKYMEQCEGQLYDYKFYCCNGVARFLFIATNRYVEESLTYDFFDMDFNKLDFHYGGRAHSEMKLEKPRFFDEMVRSAELLSKPFPFVRVDFYETDDAYYVGEMTFYSGGGILPFDPVEWDYKLGEYISIEEYSEEKE